MCEHDFPTNQAGKQARTHTHTLAHSTTTTHQATHLSIYSLSQTEDSRSAGEAITVRERCVIMTLLSASLVADGDLELPLRIDDDGSSDDWHKKESQAQKG